MKTGRINKEKEYEETINELFGEDEKPIERLGQGVHNNQFYYCVSPKGMPCLITSEKEFFRKYFDEVKTEKNKIEKISIDEIKNTFGVNYLTDFDGNAIDTNWNLTDVYKYLKGKEQKINIEQLIKKIETLNKKHVYHTDEKYHKIISYYILYTYCFTLFESAPRLNFFAMTSSGKSTQLKIIKYTKFNPLWISKTSSSSIFRSVESTCGSPSIDNFDSLNDDLKKEAFHFIETSFDKEGIFRISEAKGRNWVTKKFALFCPLEITSTMPFDDAAMDNRAILIRMEKTNKKIPKLNTKNKILREIRNECRLYVLQNFKKIIESSEEVAKDLSIEGRTLDIWQGILSLARLNTKNDYDELSAFAKELENESKQVNGSEELPKTICLLLLDKFKEQEKSAEIDLSSFVSEVLKHELNVDDTSPLVKSKHRYYLKATKNILQAFPGIWNSKTIKNVHNKIKFMITEEKVLQIMEMRGYKSEKLEKKENILTYTNQTNQLNQTNLSSPNLNNSSMVVNNKGTSGLAEVSLVSLVKTVTQSNISEKSREKKLVKCDYCDKEANIDDLVEFEDFKVCKGKCYDALVKGVEV